MQEPPFARDLSPNTLRQAVADVPGSLGIETKPTFLPLRVQYQSEKLQLGFGMHSLALPSGPHVPISSSWLWFVTICHNLSHTIRHPNSFVQGTNSFCKGLVWPLDPLDSLTQSVALASPAPCGLRQGPCSATSWILELSQRPHGNGMEWPPCRWCDGLLSSNVGKKNIVTKTPDFVSMILHQNPIIMVSECCCIS